MSDFKLEFTLKQHTPLIHFQHDQAGATLRATEVKPKLDRYIVEQMGGWHTIPKSWLVGKGNAEHESLDYKIRVLGQKPEIARIDRDAKTVKMTNKTFDLVQFFANMGNEYLERPRYISWCAASFKLEMITNEPLLRETIKNVFPTFLGKTNFGGRQNKGYGSFFIDDEWPELPGIPVLEINSGNWNDVILVINYYYQRLKSGINYCFQGKTVDYKPSFLKTFLSRPGSTHTAWEKKWLKIKFLGLVDDGKTRHFSRAFLGLPYAFQFIPKKSDCNPTRNSHIYPSRKIEIEVTQPQNQREISRIKSPITFKPIISGNRAKIFIIVEKQDQTPLLGQSFDFKQKDSAKTEALAIPPQMLDIVDLVKEFNKSLGSKFDAFNFPGKKIQVTLHP